jgi:hypothetical protein
LPDFACRNFRGDFLGVRVGWELEFDIFVVLDLTLGGAGGGFGGGFGIWLDLVQGGYVARDWRKVRD